MEKLFEDIRTWNREWKMYDLYMKYSQIQWKNVLHFKKEIKMPLTAEEFIKELNKKYKVDEDRN